TLNCDDPGSCGAATSNVYNGCTANKPPNWSSCATPGPQAVLTVVKTGGTGTVVADHGGVNCGATCSAGYLSAGGGDQVVLTATGTGGATFNHWTGATGGTTSSHCTLTMSAAKTVTATFNANPPPPCGGNGQVCCSGNLC